MIDLGNLDKFVIDDYIKDAFIGFYQHIFYYNKSEFQYDPDISVTKLNICDQFSTNDLTPEFKPTIYIRRHPFSFMNTSIDQFAGGRLGTGSSVYSDLIGGSLDIACLSSVELEANRLASIVFAVTSMFKNEICSETGLFKLDVKALGEAQPIDARSTLRIVEVPVMVQIMFQFKWITEQAAKESDKILNEIEIARSSDLQGNKLTGILKEGCKDGLNGVYVNRPTNHICIPMTEKSPKPIVKDTVSSDDV